MIGTVGDFTPDQARKEAERLRAMVKMGGDPQVAKAKE
ncbi:MAG: integrase arm-type DNA-binding domain-containing protein, partial [Devosia sp.]